MNDYVTTAQAAKLLDVSACHLRNLIADGTIHAARSMPGINRGRWRIHLHEIERIIGRKVSDREMAQARGGR